jgi:hypothetical protein
MTSRHVPVELLVTSSLEYHVSVICMCLNIVENTKISSRMPNSPMSGSKYQVWLAEALQGSKRSQRGALHTHADLVCHECGCFSMLRVFLSLMQG